MLIQVDGKDFRIPADIMERIGEAEESHKKYRYSAPFDRYALIAASVIDYGGLHLIRELKGRMDLAEKVLRRGLENESTYAAVAAYVASRIQEPLELELNGLKPHSLGSLMSKGMIIARGDVGGSTGHACFNGTVYVDGNADSVVHLGRGLVYVRGDVGKIAHIHDGVLIVNGKIKESSESCTINCAGPVSPSPFVFTSQPVKVFGYAGDSRKGCAKNEAPARDSIVIEKSRLESITPENLESVALELCRSFLREGLSWDMAKVGAFGMGEIIQFYEGRFCGHEHGYNSGHHRGVCDALPCDD